MCIAAVIFFGLLEAFCWWIFYNSWNMNGVRNRFLFVLAIFWSVIKSIFSYMLVLVAALGWGVTRPYLDKQIITKIQAICFVYIVLGFVRESVLSFRHSHSLSLAFVLLCLLPVSLLNGGIFYWVFTALSGLMETLKERRQHEKLQLFQRLWNILIATLAVATTALLAQIFDLSKSISSRWKHQWLFADGISHTLFLVVLVAMMYLWAPNKNSQRYAYSSQIDGKPRDDDVEVAESATWAAEDDLDDNDENDFWANTKGGDAVAPNTIGAGAVGGDATREKDGDDSPL
jgi:signal transduction histidine kinase